jgi:hypothetical protein
MTWTRSYLVRLKTVEQVDAELDRCQQKLRAAWDQHKRMTPWEKRIAFLSRLRGRVATLPLAL